MQVTKRTAVLAVVGMVMVSALVGGGVSWATQNFTDVPPANPFYDEIQWASTHGIVNGYPDGSFKPGANVTRQASVAFLGRYNDSIELVYSAPTAVPGPGSAKITQCPSGKRALAGGGSTSSFDLYLQDSYPVMADNAPAVNPATATGWRMYWRVAPGVTLPAGQTATGWVLCAPPIASPG